MYNLRMFILNPSDNTYIHAWDPENPDELLLNGIEPYAMSHQPFVIVQYKDPKKTFHAGFVGIDLDFRSIYFGDAHWASVLSLARRPMFHFKENGVTDWLGNLVFFRSKEYSFPVNCIASRGPAAFDSFTGDTHPDSIREGQRSGGPYTSLKFIRLVGQSMIQAYLPRRYWF